jgi:hypothetical protein
MRLEENRWAGKRPNWNLKTRGMADDYDLDKPQEQKFEAGLDGLYRKTDVKKVEKRNIPQLNQRHDLNPFRFNFVVGVPLDGQVAMKGEWGEENKFMLTVQDLRDFNLDRLSFEFTPPGVKIEWISFLARSFDLYLTGWLE